MERLGDLLFELSNDDRRRILSLIRGRPLRLTQVARELDLNVQEVSRHFSRLDEVWITSRHADGRYYLTPYGDLILRQLQEIEFTSKHMDYFAGHTLAHLPAEYVKRIGDLADSKCVHDAMDFIHIVENSIRGAEEWAWLLVDRYPVNVLALIVEALDRGVEFRIIEPEEGVAGPNPFSLEPEEAQYLRRARATPLIEQRILESVGVLLFLSEKVCTLAFPTPDEEYDYRGFTAEDELSLKWCGDLFLHLWETAEPRVYISPTEYIRPIRTPIPEDEVGGRVVVEGQDDSGVDAQAVQDAVDNYDEVILRGTFNFGTTAVVVGRGVVIRGEGRENDVPTTKVYKKGWAFPSPLSTSCPIEKRGHVFLISGEGADVTIENIHFTDFNYACIDGVEGNSMTIRNNRITLETGSGRGESVATWGDVVIGIKQLKGGFPGGVVIEGNYLDFALSYVFGGHILPRLKEDPGYRPDLLNHEYYIGMGISITNASGKVVIANNVIRNMNGIGIPVAECTASSDVIIRNNTIVSDVYGSYWMDPRWAGFGIRVQSGFFAPQPGFHIEIIDNTIKCDKPHYCGIGLRGPEFSPKGSGKLRGGIVEDNVIHLGDGSVGIFVESCDGFEIVDNTLSGKAYYGIGVFPQADPRRTGLGAFENSLADNDMSGLEIKDPNEYSKDLFDKRMYPGSRAGSTTAHILLNINTRGNTVKVNADETVIDEGEKNSIIIDNE